MPEHLTPDAKGKELERAVELIERAILSASALTPKHHITIEPRKRIAISGVTHEIDLLVTADLAEGYRARFLFECKNWHGKVGKNEVIVLSEKLRALEAQTGFLVATGFTADAVAQAEQDRKVRLLEAKQLAELDPVVPFAFHHVYCEKPRCEVRVGFMPTAHEIVRDGERVRPTQATLCGELFDLDKYVAEWASDERNTRMMSFPSGRLAGGTYSLEIEASRTFEPGALTIDGRVVGFLGLSHQFNAVVVRPSIESYIDVETRGRVVRFSEVAIGPLSMSTTLVVTRATTGRSDNAVDTPL